MAETPAALHRAHPDSRILVCDDNPSDQAIILSLLKQRFRNIQTVGSGEEALARVQRDPCDLLLLDVEMEGISGLEVLRRIRTEFARDALFPIILLTARNSQDDRLQGLKAGASDFLTKPFDPAELTARIENHLISKALYDRLDEVNTALEDERGKVVKVQLDLLPTNYPQREGLAFAARYLPSGMASGDYYDVIERPDGRVLIAIGDVSGHGIPSAMYMSILRATLRSQAGKNASLEVLLHELNHVLSHALNPFSFVTFYLAEYDPRSHRVTQASAGHPPPLLHDLESNRIDEVELNGTTPLGILDTVEIPLSEFTLGPGKRLVCFTDGITEQPDSNGQEFGLEGVRRALEMSAHLELEEYCQSLVEAFRTHTGQTPQQDDVTMLMLDVAVPTL